MPLFNAADVLSGAATYPNTSFKCEACKSPIQETVTGCRRMQDGTYRCSDCYFDQLGADLESTPITSPRIRRRN